MAARSRGRPGRSQRAPSLPALRKSQAESLEFPGDDDYHRRDRLTRRWIGRGEYWLGPGARLSLGRPIREEPPRGRVGAGDRSRSAPTRSPPARRGARPRVYSHCRPWPTHNPPRSHSQWGRDPSGRGLIREARGAAPPRARPRPLAAPNSHPAGLPSLSLPGRRIELRPLHRTERRPTLTKPTLEKERVP